MNTYKKYITIGVKDQEVTIDSYMKSDYVVAGSKNYIGFEIIPLDDLWSHMTDIIVTIALDGVFVSGPSKSSFRVIDYMIEPERLDYVFHPGVYRVSLVGYNGNLKVTTSETYFTVKKPGLEPTSVYSYAKLKKRDNFLYEIDYSGMPSYYDFAKDYINEHHDELDAGGACSIYYNDTANIFAKNFDWTYSKCVDFFVKTDTYVGVAGGIPDLKYNDITKLDEDLGKVVPWLLNSGVNKHGIAVGMNVVPSEDTKDGVIFSTKTTGTNPGMTRLCALMLPSVILDQCVDIDDLSTLLADYDIYCDGTNEYHIMVVKNGISKVIEFINNEIKVIDITDRPYLTNFYIYDSGNIETVGDLTDHATGWTRYKIMESCYNFAEDDDIVQLMRFLQFTNAYKDIDSRRDEFAGVYDEYGDITLDMAINDPESMSELLSNIRNAYIHRTRDDEKTWQTEHTVIYYITGKVVNIEVQENGVVHSVLM